MMRVNRAVLLVAAAALVSLLATIVLIEVSRDWPRPTPIAGDPSLYAEIADEVLSGAIPYIDVTVEHLPGLLVPILGVGVIAEVTGTDFAALWPLVTIAAVIGAVVLAGAVSVIPDYQRRFAVAVVPLLPLVIYRLEVFVVLLALAAIVAFCAGRTTAGSWWATAGTLAKGWPIVLFGVPLRRGAPRLAIIGAGASIAALAVVAVLPGFRDGRAFTGIHSETLVGNALLLIRHVLGDDLGLVGAAGATYVDAPPVAVVANAAIGLAIGVIALITLLRRTDLADLLRVCGLATLAIILTSPLFSAQFVFWLTPFIPLLTSRNRRWWLATAALSTLIVAFWNPFEAWWALEVAARNAVLLVLAVGWIGEVTTVRDAETDELAAQHLA